MTRQQLRDGFVQLMQELYEPEAYFDRVETLFVKRRFPFGQAQQRYWRQHKLRGLWARIEHALYALGLYLRVRWHIPNEALVRVYHRRLLRLLRTRPDPTALMIYMTKCAMHYHHYTMARAMSSGAAFWNTF
jgi:hypothetical protein